MSLAFMVLTRDPEVSRLRAQVEYLRAVYDDEHNGGEFVFGIDTRTEQSTFELIATWPGAKIVPIEWTDDFSEARNTILRNVEADWACYFDPDELPNHALLWWIHEKIREPVKAPAAYLFWFRSFFGGTNLREPLTEADWHVRMFRTEDGEFYRPVHELVRIKGTDESGARSKAELIRKAPSEAFVIHAKPPISIDRDSQAYMDMEMRRNS